MDGGKIKMQKKVDVLMATYNGEKYLKEQIDSILNQTYQNIQLIISDDCSTDKTRQILRQYEKDDRVKVFYQEKNLGYVRNFEFLLKKIENDLYMLSDQDDVWKKEKIEKSVEKLENEGLDLVFGDLEVVDENLNTIYESFDKYMKIVLDFLTFGRCRLFRIFFCPDNSHDETDNAHRDHIHMVQVIALVSRICIQQLSCDGVAQYLWQIAECGRHADSHSSQLHRDSRL